MCKVTTAKGPQRDTERLQRQKKTTNRGKKTRDMQRGTK